MKKNTILLSAFAAAAIIAPASAATLVNISHDGTIADEASPFDTLVLDGSADWTYTTDGGRSVMTATDSATSGANRLILVGADGISQFNTGGGPATKGWLFEIEIDFLAGVSQGSSGDGFANFGVRSENETGKSAMISLNELAGGTGEIGFFNPGIPTTASAGDLYNTATLDVNSLIAGGYQNFKIHKYDKAGTTTVDVLLNDVLVLSSAYSSLFDDEAAPDIQGFASATPVPSSQVNIDYINFTLYDNLLESAPIPEPGSLALIGLAGLGLLMRRRRN